MKGIQLLLALLIFSSSLMAQLNKDTYTQDVIKLALYPKCNGEEISPLMASIGLKTTIPVELEKAANFITKTRGNLIMVEGVSINATDDGVWPADIMQKPDSSTLKDIFIIQSVRYNKFLDQPIVDSVLIDSLVNANLNYNELVTSYYHNLFDDVLSKNRPMSLTTTNFDLSTYNLENDTEKAIFVLALFESCNTFIWGYMNIVRPPNYKAAHEIINQFSTINSKAYFEYTNFDFEDFNVTLETGKPKVSFKDHYISKFYSTLYYHYLCLDQKKKFKPMQEQLVSSSILTKKKYWKYCKIPSVFKIGIDQ